MSAQRFWGGIPRSHSGNAEIVKKKRNDTGETLKHTISKSQSSLEAFQEKARAEHLVKFVKSLSENKLKIIQLLDTGLYQAAISRRLKLSKSYINRFVMELLHKGCIAKDFVNPVTHVSTSYRLSPQLKEYIDKLKTNTSPRNYTLCIPHKIRFKFILKDRQKPFAMDTGRFAASKIKHIKSWEMRGGTRHLWEYQHPTIGKVGITSHINSIEVYQRDRHHILAASIDEATNIISMGISETAQRFKDEMAWCGCHFTCGTPQIVGSIHYAFPSRETRKLTDDYDGTQTVLGDDFTVDKSLEKKYGDPEVSEIETDNFDVATQVDNGLRAAREIGNIPTFIRNELKGVTESITGFNERSERIDDMCNNIQALCQSGLPLTNQFNQITGIVASHSQQMTSQSQQITKIQETMLVLTSNMAKILDYLAANTSKGV